MKFVVDMVMENFEQEIDLFSFYELQPSNKISKIGKLKVIEN